MTERSVRLELVNTLDDPEINDFGIMWNTGHTPKSTYPLTSQRFKTAARERIVENRKPRGTVVNVPSPLPGGPEFKSR